jgi:long-chain acyl-CoA synthetase
MGQTFCVPLDGESRVKYARPVGAPLSNDETAAYRCEGIDSLIASPGNGCDTTYELFQHGLKVSPDGPCVGFRSAGGAGYEWLTYSETYERSKNFGAGLVGMNMCPEVHHADELYKKTWRFVGIMSKNRVEFTLLEQGANCYNLTLVPVYDTLGADVLNFICTQTKMSTLLVSEDDLPNVFKSVEATPAGTERSLRNLIVFTTPSEEMMAQAKALDITLVTFADVEKYGQSHPLPVTPPKPEDVNTFCYTSGTTGMPKGAMVTHRQLVSVAGAAIKYHGLDQLDSSDAHLSYLPIAHILERIVNQVFFFIGARIGYYGGDTLKIVEDAQELKPTVFVSVPRLYNRIYDKIMAGVEAAGGIKKKLFQYALNAKLQRLHQDGVVTHSIWDSVVFSKPRSVLGGNVKMMLTGAAPISPHVQDALKCIFCVPIAEGYGMTESCGASCLSNIGDNVTGHVGGPIGCVELKLISVPEMSYSVHDIDETTNLVQPRGEICFKGHSVFPGYFRDAEKTKEALGADGWLRTGDIGTILPNGSLKIIDRRKNIFKLAQGEYVAAEKIEISYQQAMSVSQVFIYGKSTETFVVAIVVPDEDFAKTWYAANKAVLGDAEGSEFPGLASLVKKTEFTQKLIADMKEREKVDKLNGFEKAKKYHFTTESFTVENNLLTPTFKLKRKETRERYQKEIDEMYATPQ